jgi:signal transduction histidine kinase
MTGASDGIDTPGRDPPRRSTAAPNGLEQFFAVSTLFDAAEIVLYVADMDTHELLFMNAHAERIWGTDRIGQLCYRVLQDAQEGPCAFCTNGRLGDCGEHPVVWEFQNTHNQHWYLCIDKAIPWPGRRRVRMEVAIDITERKLDEEFRERYRAMFMHDMRDANEALVRAALDEREHAASIEDTHERQMRYLAMVAHELRNPLSPIRNAAAMLTRVADDPAMLQRVQGMIGRQVGHMTRLVEDLLDSARVASGCFRIDDESVDLVVILAQAVESCEHAIEARAQRLDLDIPAGALLLRGDAGRLAQVFGNLLENASKYTPEGGHILLGAAVSGAKVVVRVIDSGIGISRDGLQRVFNLFAQEDHALAADRRGLGIGLAVVRGLVEAHRGQIVVRSEGIGCGSTFEVTLPMDAGLLVTEAAVN